MACQFCIVSASYTLFKDCLTLVLVLVVRVMVYYVWMVLTVLEIPLAWCSARLLQLRSCDFTTLLHKECAHVAIRSDFVIGLNTVPDTLFWHRCTNIIIT